MTGRNDPLFILASLLIISFINCSPVEKESCGQKTNPDGWPWLAVLFRNSPQGLEFLCEGTLVARDKVITAAHCFRDEKELNFADVIVHLGRHSMAVWGELDTSSVHTVRYSKVHDDYVLDSWTYDADIATLTLANKAAFDKDIQPICLLKREEYTAEEGEHGFVVGWRKEELEKRPLFIAQNSTLYSKEECEKLHSNTDEPGVTAKRSFCAKFVDLKGNSRDLKGTARPFYMKKTTNGQERWVLKGIMNTQIRGTEAYVFTDLAGDFTNWLNLKYRLEEEQTYIKSKDDNEAQIRWNATAMTCARELPRQIEQYNKQIDDLKMQVEEARNNFTQAQEQEAATREDLKSALTTEQVAFLLYDIRGILKKDGLKTEAAKLLDDLIELPAKTTKILKDTEGYKSKSEANAIKNAILDKNMNSVKCMIYEGGDITRKYDDDNTALHLAAKTKQLQLFIWLMTVENAPKDVRNKDKLTAKEIAVAENLCDGQSIDWMVANDVKDMNPNGNTILHAAVKGAPFNTIKCLLDHKFSDPAVEDKDQNNALHFASTAGNLAVIKLLFEVNPNIDIKLRNKDGNTALHLAAYNNNKEVAEYLIAIKGADYLNTINYKGHSPFQVAAADGNEVADYILTVAETKNQSLASVEFSTKLRDKESLFDAQDLDGNTSLHIAAKKGNLPFVKRLVNDGADISIKNKDDKTAADVATGAVKRWLEEQGE